MRIAVTGGRAYDDVARVREMLAPYAAADILIAGAASGADTIAADVWRSMGRKVEEYPADWKTHGRAAGPIRNQRMVDSGLDLLIAFPGGRGTRHMTRRARAAGVPVIVIDASTDRLTLTQAKLR